MNDDTPTNNEPVATPVVAPVAETASGDASVSTPTEVVEVAAPAVPADTVVDTVVSETPVVPLETAPAPVEEVTLTYGGMSEGSIKVPKGTILSKALATALSKDTTGLSIRSAGRLVAAGRVLNEDFAVTVTQKSSGG